MFSNAVEMARTRAGVDAEAKTNAELARVKYKAAEAAAQKARAEAQALETIFEIRKDIAQTIEVMLTKAEADAEKAEAKAVEAEIKANKAEMEVSNTFVVVYKAETKAESLKNKYPQSQTYRDAKATADGFNSLYNKREDEADEAHDAAALAKMIAINARATIQAIRKEVDVARQNVNETAQALAKANQEVDRTAQITDKAQQEAERADKVAAEVLKIAISPEHKKNAEEKVKTSTASKHFNPEPYTLFTACLTLVNYGEDLLDKSNREEKAIRFIRHGVYELNDHPDVKPYTDLRKYYLSHKPTIVGDIVYLVKQHPDTQTVDNTFTLKSSTVEDKLGKINQLAWTKTGRMCLDFIQEYPADSICLSHMLLRLKNFLTKEILDTLKKHKDLFSHISEATEFLANAKLLNAANFTAILESGESINHILKQIRRGEVQTQQALNLLLPQTLGRKTEISANNTQEFKSSATSSVSSLGLLSTGQQQQSKLRVETSPSARYVT